MNTTQNIFKPGERIAIPTFPVLKIENDVAILKKTRFAVGAECGARHKVRIETPFFVRGGFKVQRRTMYKVPGWAFEVAFKTPYGTYVSGERVPQGNMYLDEEPNIRELAERLVRETFGSKVAEILNVEVKESVKAVDVYVRKFKHAEVLLTLSGEVLDIRKEYEGDTYFVYEFVAPDEAKLVDDTSRIDYVLLVLGHSQESRAGCAEIRVLGGDIVWSDVKRTCCAIRSSAVAVVVARYGSKIKVAYNNLPYRGCCEEWEVEEWIAEFPPRRVAQYRISEPVSTELRPEEVA